MRARGLVSADFNITDVVLPLGAPVEDRTQDLHMTQGMVADIQWSISSMPLLIGKYLRYFS